MAGDTIRTLTREDSLRSLVDMGPGWVVEDILMGKIFDTLENCIAWETLSEDFDARVLEIPSHLCMTSIWALDLHTLGWRQNEPVCWLRA